MSQDSQVDTLIAFQEASRELTDLRPFNVAAVSFSVYPITSLGLSFRRSFGGTTATACNETVGGRCGTAEHTLPTWTVAQSLSVVERREPPLAVGG